MTKQATQQILWFNEVGMGDVSRVGGKNASLGEMIIHLTKAGAKAEVKVPGGFATTAEAFWAFIAQSGLADRIEAALSDLDIKNIQALASTAADIRQWVKDTSLPTELEQAITEAYDRLCKESGNTQVPVAVRSSATAEDLPEASFAGQQETVLNVKGIDDILKYVLDVYASLFTDRAIAYRVHQGFNHRDVALSVGIQKMVRSSEAASGVMFTLDTESGFRDVVFITGSYGLGEMVVQGSVNPDEFYVHKTTLHSNRPAVLRRSLGSKQEKMIYAPEGSGKTVEVVKVSPADQQQFCLTDSEIESLARQACLIEEHYGRPMDIEWGKDGGDGELYILQARPETVESQAKSQVIERYQLENQSDILASGRSIGHKIGQGVARVIKSIEDINQVQPGDVLVTDMTDPDWEPIMKRAAAIVTNRGGRTCHAAIIARELGVPAVVGCGNATKQVTSGQSITVSCAEGETGKIYDGLLTVDIHRAELDRMPELPVKIMMNVASPDRAFDFAHLPNAGVGLARLEFIINQMIGVHPQALLDFDRLDDELKQTIQAKISAYQDPIDYYVTRLQEGVATIAAAFHPKPVIVRMSDFKSNEYANLIGGSQYEPNEENPMIGYRGASRYCSERFRECFNMECEALKRVRDDMGLINVQVMIPFVRTLTEGRDVVKLLAEQGLVQGKNDLKLIMMCELPSNALLAEQFLEIFDGFSIGSNDLTQLTLGLDRDSALIANLFDERNDAVKILLSMAIRACKKAGKYIGICGQGPSDYLDFAMWLLEQGIDSVSLNPDTVLDTWLHLAGQK